MDYAYSILMFCFSAGILLYALLVFIFGYEVIPRGYAVKPRDKKLYSRGVSRILLLVAASPALSGITALFGDIEIMWLPALAVLLVSFVVLMIIGVRLMPKQ